MDLLIIFKDFSPKVLVNGQIRMTCPFRENHIGKSSFAAGDGSNSFFATPDSNTYHCFSCKAKGTLVRLLTTVFGASYYDAVEAVKLGEVEVKSKKEFELSTFWKVEAPIEFLDRGLKKETLLRHRLGYSKTGKEIIIPLYFGKELRGLKYRAINPGHKEARFWYSDDFYKIDYLYNYDLERSIRNGYTILVEGETDTYRLEDYDYDVTATLGTSLSEKQMLLLQKIPVIYLAYDCDISGINGMHKIYKEWGKNLNIEFLNYPADDPGNCSRRGFKKAFDNPCNYAEFKLYTI